MPTVAELITLRRPRRTPRAKLLARAPAQPRRFELEYTADLLGVIRAWNAQVRRAIMPLVDEYAAPERRDILIGPAAKVLGELRGKVRDNDARIDGHAKKTARRVDRFAREQLRDTVGIPLGETLATQIDTFRRRNVELVTSVQQRQLDELEAILADAGTMRHETLAKTIEERFDVSESRAALIARDQVLKLNSQVQQEQQAQAGVTEYVWLAVKDARTRDDHAALDGTRHSWQLPPVVDEASGRRAHPGQDISCRCQAIPVVD
jgi:SPP1 gp7 family putative phage head morphogenesis protein